MATVEMFLEEKERGLYRVEIEVGFPMLRRKEFFANTGAEALRLAAEAFVEFGVDDRARVQMMRPALQADIDRAQEAQQAAGDVTFANAMERGAIVARDTPTAVTREMLDVRAVMSFAPIEGREAVEYVSESEIGNRLPVKRGPGRPRKEA